MNKFLFEAFIFMCVKLDNVLDFFQNCGRQR
jgi:hypothetical protein